MQCMLTAKNENLADEMGSRWISPKYISKYLWEYLCGASFLEDYNRIKWNDSNGNFHNFKIEASECDNLTHRKVVWGNDLRNSHATRKRKRRNKSLQVKNFNQFSKLEYPLAPNILWMSSNGNIGNKYHFQKLKKQHKTNPKVQKRRQKQINYGKRTEEYKNYLKLIQKIKRNRNVHDFKPKKQFKWNRLSFVNQVKKWRKKLHKWGQAPCFKSTGENYSGSSLNLISSENSHPTNLENSDERLENFRDKNSIFKNDSNGQVRKNYLEIIREDSEKCTEFENDLNRPIQMKNHPEKVSEVSKKYDEPGLDQISNNYNYPIRMKNIDERFKHFGNTYNKFENDLIGPIQIRNYPVIEERNYSNLNQMSGDYIYPVRMTNSNEGLENCYNNCNNSFEHNFNEPVQVSNRKVIYSEEIREKNEESIFNQKLREFGYPVSMKNSNGEFEYLNSKRSILEKNPNGFVEMKTNVLKRIPDGIDKQAESNLNHIFSTYNYPTMQNANNEHKYDSMYSGYKKDRNEAIQMEINSSKIYLGVNQENYIHSSLNRVLGENSCSVRMENPNDYFNDNYNTFRNDYNSPVEMRNFSEISVEEVEKHKELGLNKIFREFNYPIRMENPNENFKYYSRCQNQLNGPVQMKKHPLEINSEKLKNCNESNLNFVSSKYNNPINPEDDFKFIGTKCNAFERKFNGPIQVRRNHFQESCPTDGRTNVAKNWNDTYNFKKNYIDHILHYQKPLFDPTARNSLNSSHFVNKVTNAKNKTSRKISRKKARQKEIRRNQIHKANVKNGQHLQTDLVKDGQEGHRQKCYPEKSNPDQFEDIWRSPFFIIDEWNESGLSLEGEEEIMNLNSVLQQDEFPFDRTEDAKHFQRQTVASFTSTDEENNESDFEDLKRNLNCASPKNSSWGKSESDSSSSTKSSQSEVGGKRSWKNFERNYLKVW